MKAEYIDHLGDDLRVVNAARVSFDKESAWEWERVFLEDEFTGFPGMGLPRLSEKDAKLIGYLAKHGHWTPFAHCSITMRETVPIFIARQRFKHSVGFVYNEVSRRYVDSAPEFFYPTWRKRAENAKQGSAEAFEEEYQEFFTARLRAFHERCEVEYRWYLDQGVAPEQARMVLPQSMYTSYYVTGSLAAWARAYKQRTDDHAQKEISDLAAEWDKVISPLFPVAWDALTQ